MRECTLTRRDGRIGNERVEARLGEQCEWVTRLYRLILLTYYQLQGLVGVGVVVVEDHLIDALALFLGYSVDTQTCIKRGTVFSA